MKMNDSSDLAIIKSIYEDDDYLGDCSDDGLKIVIDSPQSKRRTKSKPLNIEPNDKKIIESVENEIEKTLDEKAAKTNLTASNVKNILKHVVTNEHVLAMVRQTEDPNNSKESLTVYEPKLTRAKAKELLSLQAVAPIPWIKPPKPPTEVQVLINEELVEDSSDDEYVPAEEESEDDRDSFASDAATVSPAPSKNTDTATQTNWSDDGVFKVPQVKITEDAVEKPNIAWRTRSKLCLSSTPLEVIEEAFIPPDITTDMYDMECDDDEWKDFLKKFTRPLDEVIRHAEDEDHDPEYNILADEEIDKVDKEELREDKGVKVTRKELNELIAELFEYADNFTNENEVREVELDLQPQFTVLNTYVSEQTQTNSSSENVQHAENVVGLVETEPIMIEATQKLLLEQQMRQHVQMLTQNFLLAYEHPEYSELADKCREYLYNLKFLPGDRENSYFLASNLQSAIKLVEYWQDKFCSDDDEVKACKQYVSKVLIESKQNKSAGLTYIPTFPPLILETISKSDVFLYPLLLPRIPFKSASLFPCTEYTKSENELLALGLEQFIPFLQDDSYHVTAKGEVRLSHVCHYIQKYMMPTKDAVRMYKHVSTFKQPRCEQNPIKYYFENKKAPVTFHYVVQLEQLGVVPPCQRKSDQLPYQWKKYIYPNEQEINTFVVAPGYPSNITKVVKPPVYNKNFTIRKRFVSNASPKKSSTTRKKTKINHKQLTYSEQSFSDFRSSVISSTPIRKSKKLEQYFNSPSQTKKSPNLEARNLLQLKFNSSILQKFRLPKKGTGNITMLPSMPSLNTPVKHSPERCPPDDDFSTLLITQPNEKLPSMENVESVMDDASMNVEKDNIDDINALMVASSTITTMAKKRLSGAEKKKAKLQKEFNANMSMLSPEDPNVSKEKANMFVQAFYDKLQERLEMHDYHRLMEVLNEFDENVGSVPDLYRSVNEILHLKYPDLTDEFLTFLTSAQAKAVGKLVPHLILNNMSLFLRKLEMYFKDHPTQVRKIYRSLTELTACKNITMDKVKSTILPLLKGNTLLTDWFLQIFPCEKPPKSLLDGPWENIEIGKENTVITNENIYETIVVPEVEDPYGGPNCVCSCHNVDDLTFKSRSRHCIPCGTKFLQGRVFIQTGKGLRLAKVTFNSNSDIDHYARLNCRTSVPQQKRKSEANSTKQVISPNKDSQDEIRMSNDSEEDGESAKKRNSKSVRKPRQRKPRKTDKSVKSNKEKNANASTKQSNVESCNNIVKPLKGDIKKVVETITQNIVACVQTEPLPSCSGLNQQKSAADELMELDYNTSIESVQMELRLSLSAESESEENSQDNRNSDSDDNPTTLPPSENGNSETISWTREEDKIILETLQKEGNREETFTHISQLLENRSVANVKGRFQKLMNLLQAMAAESVS